MTAANNEGLMMEAWGSLCRMGKELDAQSVPKNRIDVQRYVDMLSIMVNCLDASLREEVICTLLALGEPSAKEAGL